MSNSSIEHTNLNMSENTITVFGTGTIEATPDVAFAVIGAENTSKRINEAQKENAETISTIVNTLNKMGIPNEDIQTAEYRIEEEYTFENNTKQFIGYRVTHLLNVLIEPIQKTGAVLDAAVASGANNLSGIQFKVKEPEKYNQRALTLAIEQGNKKAKDIAHALKVPLPRTPHQVTEIASSSPVYRMLSQYEGTPIQPGQLTMTAQVKMVYVFPT
ncbi:SIMPL domain-containing protein [Alkalihalobacillus macyae]|uniref:SIMPL domain-containing protein n=1 Tax=Guptibacillus hwajinpoensis TaxID=208199 RepID=UPI00273C7357|nr:SIMPL domain-containing protein [Alkalihalobacillus macyae]MDP4549907.1 SIMPL domain-containing protein [Alkalihalobacillus macyae]